MGKAFFNAFLGPDQKLTKKDVPMSMLVGMGVLTVVVIIFTLFPNIVVSEIVTPAVEALVRSLQGAIP